jgi:hypothetical protein
MPSDADSDVPRHHIAQYNIAKLRRPLDDPANQDFVGNLARINGLGDRTPGFVWRHQTDSGDSTAVRVRDDPMIIINFTVWDSIEALFEYAYHSEHADFFRRRREWFEAPDAPYLVLWWVAAGHVPSVAEAEERLDYLRAHGPTAHAFTFKQRFPSPGVPAVGSREASSA